MSGNIVKLRLQEGRATTSSGLYQYDYGQKLVFTGAELPETYEVHFSNCKEGRSKTMIGTPEGVDIPDEFLLCGEPVYVWVFLHNTETDGETEYEGVINVTKRARPTETKIRPVQQDVITKAIAALHDAVQKTAQDVIAANEAKDAAEAAQGLAEAAQAAAEIAAGLAEDYKDEANASAVASAEAQSAAEAAQSAAETAQALAESAKTAAEAAQTAAESAAASAGEYKDESEAAKAAAEAAQAAAERAQAASETAQAAAEAARARAESAQTAAENAQTAAENAQAQAENAQHAAESAQQSAENAQAGAEEAQSKAEDAQAAAETAQAASETARDTAEQWTTGGTSGTPSATNNAKYYAEQAAASATTASNKADEAAQSAQSASEDAEDVRDIAEAMPQQIQDALQAAKDSGEFDGFSPIATVVKNDNVATITITDLNGTTTTQVFDGDDPSDLIDDTAGAGDTDKVWSADKTTAELSAKADKTDTVLNTTLSRGRKTNTTVGTGSFAFGSDVEASGNFSHAEGGGTTASGQQSHAEGGSTIASGNNSHAEGGTTKAIGEVSHAEGGGTIASGAQSHAEGSGTTASGQSSHSEGAGTAASAQNSHAEGGGTTASGINSHAEGGGTTASGVQSHAEGGGTTASGAQSHAEGGGTIAVAENSHVFGTFNQEDSYDNWQEWTTNTHYNVGDKVKRTIGSGANQSIEGYICNTENTDAEFISSKWESRGGRMNYVEIVGNGKNYNARSNARTLDWDGNEHLAGGLTLETTLNRGRSANTAVGFGSFAFGHNVEARGDFSHAEGLGAIASGFYSHAEGANTIATGVDSHAEGGGTMASGESSHAEGNGTKAQGTYSHAEGGGTTASKTGSHAEGSGTTASGENAHAEGSSAKAQGDQSHAEGTATTASGISSHAEGAGTTSSGISSHAEGSGTTASGNCSHSEGANTTASGNYSHVEGLETVAAGTYSHVFGCDNVSDSYSNWNEWVADTSYSVGDKVKRTFSASNIKGYICKTANSDSTFTSSKWTEQYGKMNYVEIVGNGTGTSNRSNARTLDWDGNEYLYGDVYVHANTDSTGGAKVATEDFADDIIVVQDTVPLTSQTKIWLPETQTTPVQIPTYTEFSSLQTTVDGLPTDVQINGTSIVSQGVANVPVAGYSTFGVAKFDDASFFINSSSVVKINRANDSQVKLGTDDAKPLVPNYQHKAVFYGLSKLAGEDLKNDTVTVGTYPEKSKSAINQMLNAPETVSGSNPSITAKAGVRYICGECSTLTIVVPATGIIDVVFESGSTATVLTVTPPTGMTMKWANGFDPTSLEASTLYEINILDGCMGVAGSWT